MGLLQVGWVAVDAAIATSFIMKGLGQTSRTLYSVIALVWLYSLGWVAIKGIHYVGQVAKFLNWVPFLMMLIVLWANRSGIPQYQPAHNEPVDWFSECADHHHRILCHRGSGGHRFRHE